jgi:hypothetical protein
MNILEIMKSNLGVMTLDEQDKFVSEMANFFSDVTDLPANIVLWTRTQPGELPHVKYRIKVFKDRVHVATVLISRSPRLIWEVSREKYKLDSYELEQVLEIVSEYSTIFIQLVDGKLSRDQVQYEIKRIRNAK